MPFYGRAKQEAGSYRVAYLVREERLLETRSHQRNVGPAAETLAHEWANIPAADPIMS